MGKTHEIKSLSEYESTQFQGPAILLELADEATSPRALEAALGDALSRDGIYDGAIYLDALDEACALLPTAVNIFRKWLTGIAEAKKKVPRLRISCRTAVWPVVLAKALDDLSSNGLVVAELQPLNQEKFSSVARACLEDPDDFIHAVDEKELHSVASHPQSLQMLMGLYSSTGELSGNRSQLFDRSINYLLAEDPEKTERGIPSKLELSVARPLAEALACAAVLAGKSQFSLVERGALEQGVVMPQELAKAFGVEAGLRFDEQTLRDMAHTGLFTSRGDRHFQFVHKQFAEFLTGSWIARLPGHQAQSLLRSPLVELQGVPEPLGEVAAWAACQNNELADWLANASPEVIGRSDIASLELRRQAFVSLVSKYRSHQLTFMNLSSSDQYRGLNYPGVETDLCSLLKERGEDLDDVQQLAARLAQDWRCESLSVDLADLMLDEHASAGARVAAGRALQVVGSNEDRLRIKPLINSYEIGDRLRGVTLRCCWPDHMTCDELFSVLRLPQQTGVTCPRV